MEIRRATTDDVDTISQILTGCALWIYRTFKVTQWPVFWPREMLEEFVTDGVQYVVIEDDEVIGSVMLQHEDPAWTGIPGNALYVHMLAIEREHKSRGLGEQVLDWAIAQARAAGHSHLRLDCFAESLGLRRYYSNLGFVYHGDVIMAAPKRTWVSSLMELEIA